MGRPGNSQRAAFAYIEGFRKEGSENALSSDALAEFLARDDYSRDRYAEAFERSDFEAMMNLYRQNPSEGVAAGAVDVPVLQFHGLDDPVLLADSLNGTWQHLAHCQRLRPRQAARVRRSRPGLETPDRLAC